VYVQYVQEKYENGAVLYTAKSRSRFENSVNPDWIYRTKSVVMELRIRKRVSYWLWKML